MIEAEKQIGDTRVLIFKTRQEALDYAVQKEGRNELYAQIEAARQMGWINDN